MNNETKNWKLNTINVWINCVPFRECRICRFRESSFHFFFPGEHASEPHYIIRTFGADSTLVSPVTLVLNVQLLKNSIRGQNEWWYRETVVQNLHNSLWKQKFEHQRNTTQNKTKAAVERATKNVQLVLQHCCKPSWVAMLRVLPPMFDPVLQEIRL